METHLRACGRCAAAVAAAEAAAASLASALPPAPERARRPRFGSLRALAAAAVVALAAAGAVEGVAANAARAQVDRDDRALVAIASSHFNHTTLDAMPGVVAKTLYARDGSWCYVVATGVSRDARVIALQHGTRRDLGALAGGAPATLFLRGVGRVDDVAIVDGGRSVAHGKPAY